MDWSVTELIIRLAGVANLFGKLLSETLRALFDAGKKMETEVSKDVQDKVSIYRNGGHFQLRFLG